MNPRNTNNAIANCLCVLVIRFPLNVGPRRTPNVLDCMNKKNDIIRLAEYLNFVTKFHSLPMVDLHQRLRKLNADLLLYLSSSASRPRSSGDVGSPLD